jgi:hypothetical protein
MNNLRVIRDSVAGSRCCIVYFGQHPYCTIWIKERKVQPSRQHLPDDCYEELMALLDTLNKFEATPESVTGAVTELIRRYLK